MGASAGGHLATTLATHQEDVSMIGDSLDIYLYHPDFQILISPVITMGTNRHQGSFEYLLGENPPEQLIEKYSNELNVSSSTSPCFMVHAGNDKSVSPWNSIMYFEALLKQAAAGFRQHQTVRRPVENAETQRLFQLFHSLH